MMKLEGAPTKSSTFELFTTIEAVTELEKPDIIFGDRINQVPCSPELAKSELVMIFVVKDIDERGQEGMQLLMPTNTIGT